MKNKENLYNYLIENEMYNIIYQNEELHENIKIKHNILILSLNDINIDNLYDNEEIKLEYIKKFQNYNVIFI